MSLNFIPTSITIKVKLEEQVTETTVEAVVAEQTGLAYIIHSSEQGTHITFTHVTSQTSVGHTWGVTTEQEAKECIALLHKIVDWTEYVPRIRHGKFARVLDLAVIGAINEVTIEEAQ